jgi:tetraacyldisaccharide 4'-kinase
MRAPAFWSAPDPTLAASLLAPLGALYGAVAAQRMGRRGLCVEAPVVCIGNFTAGGAGKTPTAIAAARALRAMGERPFFLSRGYGARASHRTPLRVDLARHGAGETGDEPLLLAREAATFVCADRAAGALAAVRAGASVVVMDDGLQNPALHKDLAIAVVDAQTGVGNGLCIPAGPLRAPLEAQWAHVDAALIIGEETHEAGRRLAYDAQARGLPVLRALLAPDAAQAHELLGRRVVAFAGIGRPEKFFDTLRAAGALIAQTRAFADHHVFSQDDLAGLRALAAREQAALVTTRKDFVRMGEPADVAILDVALRLRAPQDFADLLAQGLARARAG